MKDFTTSRPDGFGAQLNAMLVGFLVARQQGCDYYYTPFREFKLLKVGHQNNQLNVMNKIISTMAYNLGVERASGQVVMARPYDYCNEDTFRGSSARALKFAWPLPTPFTEKTCVVHIRRGYDIDTSHEHRWQTCAFVDNLVKQCIDKFPDHVIEVLCWGDPELCLPQPNDVRYDIVYDGNDIFNHFHKMVHADVLVVAHSSFSLSAGLLNKNTVICPKGLLKTKSAHHPKEWDDNWKKYLG